MSDIDTQIARWMGWTDVKATAFDKLTGIPPGMSHQHFVPDYTSSLDAQVPVWEALREKGVVLSVRSEYSRFGILPGQEYWASTYSIPHNPIEKYAGHPAEAAARAIYEAIKALGGSHD